MAATGDGLESKDLQTMISDRNETAEMMVKRVWPRVDSWKVQWSKKLTSMRFKVRWHDDSPKGTITLSEGQWAKCQPELSQPPPWVMRGKLCRIESVGRSYGNGTS